MFLLVQSTILWTIPWLELRLFMGTWGYGGCDLLSGDGTYSKLIEQGSYKYLEFSLGQEL
jgi:hypothetical protein